MDFNDADIAERVDALEIYRGIYDVSSDWSHQLFTVMLSVLKELHDTRVVTIGPTYASATYVALSVRDYVNRLLADSLRHFGLDVGEEPLQLDRNLTNAIRTYTICKGDQESMARARELLAQEESAAKWASQKTAANRVDHALRRRDLKQERNVSQTRSEPKAYKRWIRIDEATNDARASGTRLPATDRLRRGLVLRTR